jgi:hypothetical protein
MRLPSYKPVLVHRPNPLPPRPRNLLPSTPARPPSPDDQSRPTRLMSPSILQPKPRTAVSAFLSPSDQHHQRHHPNDDLGGASPGRRPIFSSARRERSVDGPREYQGAHREPSPARSAVSQPPTSTAVVASGGPEDSDARVSLWAELKDIRRRTRTPGGSGLPTSSHIGREPSATPMAIRCSP